MTWWGAAKWLGLHHGIVVCLWGIAAGLGAWAVAGPEAANVVGYTAVTGATSYYAGRERIFDKLRGDGSAGGRWRDFLVPLAVWAWVTVGLLLRLDPMGWVA